MNKVVEIKEAVKIAQKLRRQNKTIVIVGGFFDILHPGHIKFLENAKKYGDCLFVLLENDAKARTTKGINRPINSQKNRATVLSSLQVVDYIVLLKSMTNNAQYDKLISQIAPSVIATTYGDPYINHKKRQAKLVNGKVVCVTKRISAYSATKFIDLMNKGLKKKL
ncbi:MAG: adenylyltransferase/cytidyltransferase family protein [Candidatus Levybacteria bacterium]|nr:adenylyltransferase/cytidyltransferase family protein [Candidatus Levybacteria bacterium]